nr:hypothetical protein [Streptomyces sp. SID5468]
MACEICDRPSGAGTRVHRACEQRLAQNLAALPSLYRGLTGALEPGRSPRYGGRPGSRTAPMPVREDVLDLVGPGGIEGVLLDWERDLRDHLGWPPPQPRGSVERTVNESVDVLLRQVRWVCSTHPAVQDFARDVAALRARCERVLGIEHPRWISVRCPCGARLTFVFDTAGERCGRCQTSYPRAAVLQLPLVERSAA